MSPRTPVVPSLLASLLVPLILVGFALRVLLTPLFYTIEYNLPYFPQDRYGFGREDRLRWAPFAVNYLINRADIDYLRQLRFDDESPLFNERELVHMQDVKRLVQASLRIWYGALSIQGFLWLFAWLGKWMRAYLAAWSRGGWWMIGLALILILIAAGGILIDPDIFWDFFALFHQAFFEGNSWLFLYSDTLIRLFPIRFWQDAVLAASFICLGGGFGLAIGLGRFKDAKTSNHFPYQTSTSRV